MRRVPRYSVGGNLRGFKKERLARGSVQAAPRLRRCPRCCIFLVSYLNWLASRGPLDNLVAMARQRRVHDAVAIPAAGALLTGRPRRTWVPARRCVFARRAVGWVLWVPDRWSHRSSESQETLSRRRPPRGCCGAGVFSLGT